MYFSIFIRSLLTDVCVFTLGSISLPYFSVAVSSFRACVTPFRPSILRPFCPNVSTHSIYRFSFGTCTVGRRGNANNNIYFKRTMVDKSKVSRQIKRQFLRETAGFQFIGFSRISAGHLTNVNTEIFNRSHQIQLLRRI